MGWVDEGWMFDGFLDSGALGLGRHNFNASQRELLKLKTQTLNWNIERLTSWQSRLRKLKATCCQFKNALHERGCWATDFALCMNFEPITNGNGQWIGCWGMRNITYSYHQISSSSLTFSHTYHLGLGLAFQQKDWLQLIVTENWELYLLSLFYFLLPWNFMSFVAWLQVCDA